MISSLDMLYLILSLGVIVVAGVFVVLAFHVIQILQDVKRISQRVEEISALLQGISHIAFPGIEKVAQRANRFEEKVGDFLEKKVDKLLK